MSEPNAEIATKRLLIADWNTRALELDGNGPTLIFLHGFSDNAETWIPVLEQLAARGQRAVALDLPNHGHADPLEPGAILTQLDRFVTDAVRHWTEGGQAPVLVGNSLGGVLAIRAAQNPNLALAGVMPISPAGYGHAWWIEVFTRYAWLNPLMFVPLVPMRAFQFLAAVSFAKAASGRGRLLPGVARSYAAQYQHTSDPRRLLGTAALLLAAINESATDLAPLQVPTKVLWGTHDKLTLARGATRIRAVPGELEIVLLNEFGHCPHLEDAGLIAAHIAEFLEQCAPARQSAVRHEADESDHARPAGPRRLLR